MSQENPFGEARYFAFYAGVVVANADPRKLGRVRVQIPGLIDGNAKSAWALPLGQVGSGGTRRGLKMTPRRGDEVGVLFKQGDIDHPYYLTGNWGAPKGVIDTPGGGRALPDGNDELDEVGEELDAATLPDVEVFETDSFVVAFDERVVDGKRLGNLQLRHKKSGDAVSYTSESSAWQIVGTGPVEIKSALLVNIVAPQVQINGRIVRTTEDPT